MAESIIINLPLEDSCFQSNEQGIADVTAQFSVTCPGETRLIEWGFEHYPKGECHVENFWSSTFVYPIKRGDWTFWVKDPGGPNAEVRFKVI